MRIGLILAGLCGLAFGAACTTGSRPAPLAAVSPLPEPTVPAWIVEISPQQGRAPTDPLAQVRIRFRGDVIPLGALEDPNQQEKLSHFRLDPPLPGRFRFLTPRMVGFEADAAWPISTRIRVTLTKGLSDLAGDALAEDLAWTFETETLSFSDLPSPDPNASPVDLNPTLRFSANADADPSSLLAHALLVSKDGSERIPMRFPPGPTASPSTPAPGEAFNPAERAYSYSVVPSRPLKRATGYRLQIGSGVQPKIGNLASSDDAISGTIQTFGPLAFTGVVSFKQAGFDPFRFIAGGPVLQFSNPLIAASAKAAIHVSPPSADDANLFQLSDGDVQILINPDVLNPATVYTFTIGASLKDTFGQTLGSEQRADFRTGDLLPAASAPSGLTIFPAGSGLKLNVSSVNIQSPSVRMATKSLSPGDVVQYDTDAPPLPSASSWPALSFKSTKNVPVTTEVPLAGLGKTGALAYGVAAQSGAQGTQFTGFVQLTNLGAFAQIFPGSALVRVNHLTDGSPVAGARIEFYPSQTDAKVKSTPVPCATATTDATGIASVAGAGYASCAASATNGNQAPSLVAIVRQGDDWSYVRTDDGSGIYEVNVYAGWSAGAPDPRGTIFSDRDLYQPGETAQFTAVGYFLTNGRLIRGSAASYDVTLESPSGTKTSLGRKSLNAYGTFSFPIAFSKAQELGNYHLRASGANGETIDGYFRVAEFRPPNFKVELSLDRKTAARGDTVTASAKRTYLFGAPVEGGNAHVTVTRQPSNFTPPGRDDFIFGRHWFWPEDRPSTSTDVLDTTAPVGPGGATTASVVVPQDLPYPMDYEVDVETTDVSNLASAANQTFTALPSPTLIGVRSDFLGTEKQAFPVDVIATDPAGKAQSGVKIHLELQFADYAQATQLVEGGEEPQVAVKYETVAETDVTSADSPVRATLTPTKPGSYRIRATFANADTSGAKDDASATDAQIWVAGSGTLLSWLAPNPNVLQVKLDKTSYGVGDTATALVALPFPDADVMIAVARHEIMWKKVATVHGTAAKFTFTVTPDMLPNVAVEAVAVRRGKAADPLSRYGMAPLAVALDSRYLKVDAVPQRGTVAPGDNESVKLRVRDARGNPVHGQFTVIVANDAVLRLTGYRPPDLVKLVYADQPISTRFADNRLWVALKSPASALDKGFGYGGGFEGGPADTRVRTNFQPLAFFAGAVESDAQGNATVSFKLPDDLTTWRIMAVAATADARFGNGENSFIATKPLLANPVVPQFARPGDRFDAGVAVTNAAKLTGTLSIAGSLFGPIDFLSGDKQSSTVSLDTPLEAVTKAYRFSMTANSANGDAKVRFTIRAPGAADGFEIPLLLRDQDVLESVVTAGSTTSSVDIPLAATGGRLDVNLASSMIPAAVLSAQRAFSFDWPFAETLGSRIAIAASTTTLAQRNAIAPDPQLAKRAAADFKTLSGMQNADGGFGFFPGAERSNPWVTAVVVEDLGGATALHLDASWQGPARTYLRKLLADPAAIVPGCKDAPLCLAQLRLRALLALAATGEVRSDSLDAIVPQAAKLDLVDRIALARYLTRFPAWSDAAQSLARSIEAITSFSGRAAVINVPAAYGWTCSLVAVQAQALRLSVARNAGQDEVDRQVRALLDMRQNGAWPTTFDDAQALAALIAAAGREPANAAFTATARLGSAPPFLRAQLNPAHPTVSGSAAPSASDRSAGLAKDGTGTLHYVASYTYRMAADSPGILNGIRVTRTVAPAGSGAPLATMGLTKLGAAVNLPAANVFDVGVQVIVDHPVTHVLIVDPLPAGVEAVDASFATANHFYAARSQSWQIDWQTIYHDRVEAYAQVLTAGVYEMHYLVRTVTPGTYAWPGTQARLEYAPEEFGRTAAATLVVK